VRYRTINLLVAFKHSDHICEIYINSASVHGLEDLAMLAMRDPLPALTVLDIRSDSGDVHKTTFLSDSFLGGCAPRLRSLYVEDMVYPALPKLLSSSTSLVYLLLGAIPPEGYISPEVMVDCLSLMTTLEQLQINFHIFAARYN
jgi:hypothetical protein